MSLRLTALALALSACASPADGPPPVAGGCPAEGVIGDPPQLVWAQRQASDRNPTAYYEATLEVGEATFEIDGRTVTTRAYRQAGGTYSIPGPTMVMVPGETYVLRLHNRLPPGPTSDEVNVLKDPNVTDLHAHGLHVSPVSPGPDTDRMLRGGEGGDYVLAIGADHMGGTHAYYARHHGSTFLQVSGGLFGQIVIDERGDDVPPNVRAMAERPLVVARLDPSVAGAGGDTLLGGSLGPTWTVNGRAGGSICVPAHEWQRWRLLLVDAEAAPRTLRVGDGCEVQLLARDGVWRTVAPAARPDGELTLTGGARANLAVRCAGDTELTVDGRVVATVAVGPDGDPAPHPFGGGGEGTLWSAARPSYLRDLRGATDGVGFEYVQMGSRGIDGGLLDREQPTFALLASQVQQWSVTGADGHPLHLHVYPVQAVDCGGGYEDGEYYDVIAAADCAVRFDLDASTSSVFAGRTPLSSQAFEHADRGAVGWIEVLGGAGPASYPADADASFAARYPLDEEPPPDPCGDGACDGAEDACSCAADCGAPPAAESMCTGGGDEDCDGDVDCDDVDCAGDAACAVSSCGDAVCGAGEDCESCNEDCPGRRNGRPSERFCCGDGVSQTSEGDGALCDGNF